MTKLNATRDVTKIHDSDNVESNFELQSQY